MTATTRRPGRIESNKTSRHEQDNQIPISPPPEERGAIHELEGKGTFVPNLIQNIDIVIREATPSPAPRNTSVSRSKKKIFQQSPTSQSHLQTPAGNTPHKHTQTQTTPAESRLRKAIFGQNPHREVSYSRSRSVSRGKRIFGARARDSGIEADINKMKDSLGEMSPQSSFKDTLKASKESSGDVHSIPVTFSSKEQP